MSPATATTRAPAVACPRISSAAARSADLSRPSITSDQPALASPVANASPSPRDAPVTMATLMAVHPSERWAAPQGQYNKDILSLFHPVHRGRDRLPGLEVGPPHGLLDGAAPDVVEGVGELGR